MATTANVLVKLDGFALDVVEHDAQVIDPNTGLPTEETIHLHTLVFEQQDGDGKLIHVEIVWTPQAWEVLKQMVTGSALEVVTDPGRIAQLATAAR
jgi:hypothetical protein